MSSRVAIVKGLRGHEPVFQALDLINYESALKDFNRVLIKVNFITTMTWDTGATTDPMVVEALILRLKSVGKEVYVVESDASITSADKAVEATGMGHMCKRNGVKFLNLRYVGDVSVANPRFSLSTALRETASSLRIGQRLSWVWMLLLHAPEKRIRSRLKR